MTCTICIANVKGGVGKSTTAVNLGAGLALKGKNVLVVDLDPQGNTTRALLPADYSPSRMVKDLFYGHRLSDVTYASVVPNLDIAPTNMYLFGIESEMSNKINRERMLQAAFERSDLSMYDFVVIDTPPSIGFLPTNALGVTQKLLVPVCEVYALDGVDMLQELIKDVRAYVNPLLDINAILLTRFDRRTNVSKDVKDIAISVFKDRVLQTIIPTNTKLIESPSHNQAIFSYAPESAGAIAYENLADEIIKLWG